MDGRTFRYHDNHEFFRSTTAVESGEVRLWPKRLRWPANGPKSAGSLLLPPPAPPGEHHRHCTAWRSPANLATRSATFWR